MLTTRCNLGCAYCYQERGAPASMPIRILEAGISLFLRSDCDNPTLDLFGGEPLLEKSLVRRAVEIVRAGAPTRMRPDVRICTNGLLLDPETARFLVDADVHITLSIDGVPGAQDRRGRGSFDVLDRMLTHLRVNHPGHFRNRLTVKATLTSANVPHLADSFRYFVSRGVGEIDVAPLITSDPGWGPAARDELDTQLAGVVEESLRVHASLGEVPFLAFRSDGRRNSPQAQATSLCTTATRKELFVDVDGSLAPCAAMARSCVGHPVPLLRDAIEALGSIHIEDPNLDDELLARERRVRELPLLTGKSEKRSPFGRCRDCSALGNCFICPASIALGGVDSTRIPAIQCDFNRMVDKHRAALHSRIRASAPTILDPQPIRSTVRVEVSGPSTC